MISGQIRSGIATVAISFMVGSRNVASWLQQPLRMASSSRSPNTIMSATGSKPSVAIIGGGIAGLSCANELSSKFDVTVFDTGRLRPGGRCSSRQIGDISDKKDGQPMSLLSEYTIDHAAQILTVVPGRYPSFDKQVEIFEMNGVITEYPKGSVCYISTKNYNPNKPKGQDQSEEFVLRQINTGKKDSPKMYYGSRGMGSIPDALAKGANGADINTFELKQDVWVSPSNGIQYQKNTNKWKIQAKGQSLGVYDKLCIAHNGKCADRIMSKSPAKDFHSLLRVNFAPSVPNHGGQRMTLNSIYSLVVALPKSSKLSNALPKDAFVCGLVQNESTLRMISCNTRKYPSDRNSDDVEVWTILSSPQFAKKYKAPQEFLPPETIANVTKLMLDAVERSLNIVGSDLAGQIVESYLQLWGAAVPLNVWDSSEQSGENPGFIFDAKYGVGACGDWLLEPSIAGAWESGRRLAQFMASERNHESIGLPPHGKFRASDEARKAGVGALR